MGGASFGRDRRRRGWRPADVAPGDPDEATRCAAALGLGQLRAAAAVPALTAQLGDANGWVRDTAADALAMIGEPALPALVETLNDGPDGARVRAAGALRKIVGAALTDRQTGEFEPQFWPGSAPCSRR